MRAYGIILGKIFMEGNANACINVKPEGEGGGAYDFSEEFLVKIPAVGSQNLVN